MYRIFQQNSLSKTKMAIILAVVLFVIIPLYFIVKEPYQPDWVKSELKAHDYIKKDWADKYVYYTCENNELVEINIRGNGKDWVKSKIIHKFDVCE